MLTVVTGWSPAGYLEYGRRFAETFDRYWPPAVNLVVYGEQPCVLPRGEFRTLDQIPGCMEFLERNDTPKARGEYVPGESHNWKPSAVQKGYNFRFDARKFSRQGFIPMHAYWQLSKTSSPDGSKYLCWLDGDVVTHRKIPSGFIESLLPLGASVAYLGRGAKHSEIGFQLYDVSHAWAGVMLHAFAAMYAIDAVFRLKEWHSAYVFDEVRRRCERQIGMRSHDLTPGGSGHVWHQSPLRIYMDHLKGKRKEKGRSDERIG